MKPTDSSREETGPLTPERWAHVRALVEEALTLPAEERLAFLEASCGGDHALRDRVERLAASCERTGENWGFLAHPAGDLVAPLLLADQTLMANLSARTDGPSAAFCAALADRYAVGAELGRGGMATVYAAEDLRHHRRVAVKVLDPELGALIGADRFLAEIRVTAGLLHPNLLPLFDSGVAGGLVYYVMPLIEGATLRARLHRERQLPVDEAVRIVRVIAGALDYAHRQGVVHRDLKPENILLQDGEPLVADFGIALAVRRAADTHLTATGMSLGTPKYMSPEQATGSVTVDGRSDIYSLAAVLYELLTGDPPFTGSTAQAVIARVISDVPSSVRTVRPSVPAQVEAVLARALAKLPADRFATAREFADALVLAPVAAPIGARPPPARWRNPTRLLMGAAAVVATTIGGWIAFDNPEASSTFVHHDLIDQSLRSAVTITPDGRTLVYTGSPNAGWPIMVRPVGQLEARALAGTERGQLPFVSPDGQRLAFVSLDGELKTVSLEGVAGTGGTKSWRYGNGAWVGDSAVVTEFGAPGLSTGVPGGGRPAVLTVPDTALRPKHFAPLLIPGSRAVVFTVSRDVGPAHVAGELAIATLDPRAQSASPYVLLGVAARRAIAFVDGWLLFTNVDGRAVMAVRLDLERSRISGTPVSVLDDEAGNLETAALANNGTLLYVRRPRNNTAVFVDSSGAVRPGIASPDGSFMYPRISPLGKRFAVQVTTGGSRVDLWLYDIATGTRTQLTTTGRARHPTWTPDGRRIAFWDSRLGLMSQLVDGPAAVERVVDSTGNPRAAETFAPTVTPDGRSVVFQRRSGTLWHIWSASLNRESPPRMVMDVPFGSSMPAVSPDGDWLAYVSTTTGNEEVYVRRFPGPGTVVQVSDGGGIEPSWSPDGHRIYYLNKSALIAAEVTTPALAITARRQLFKGPFDSHLMPHRNYDVAPDGKGFLMIAAPPNPEVVVVLNWMTDVRARLKRAAQVADAR